MRFQRLLAYGAFAAAYLLVMAVVLATLEPEANATSAARGSGEMQPARLVADGALYDQITQRR